MLNKKNLISPSDFSVDEINEILNLANKIIENPIDYSNLCNGKILATLFYEPSTRTRLSFESAMLRLGGSVIGFDQASTSSVTKGESLQDTIQTVSCYSDIIAMRHPQEGSANIACENSNVPFINAGDGSNHHPTQTLTDLLTIYQLKSNLNNHIVALCGDLKFSRTVHSLVRAMNRYKNIKFIFISPKELKIPQYIKDELLENNYQENENLEDVIDNVDILYMTRVQRERFEDKAEYERLKDTYILNKQKITNAKKDMIIMHALPRVNEIDKDVDSDDRAVYFKQVKYGMYVRMALILKMLEATMPSNQQV